MAVGISRRPLACILFAPALRYRTYNYMDKNTLRSKFHPPHRDITFIASGKSTASLARKSAMIIMRGRKGAIGLFENSTSCLGNDIFLSCFFYNDEITLFISLFEMSTMRNMAYLVEIYLGHFYLEHFYLKIR